QLPKVFSEADILMLPYDFSPLSLKFIRYSIPTKLPEFMISGTPIIIFAPAETAIVKYSQKNNCARIITENNSGKISEEILELIRNKSLREFIGSNAKKVAEQNHNSSL